MAALLLISSLALSLSGAPAQGSVGAIHATLTVVQCPTTFSNQPAQGLPTLPTEIPVEIPASLRAAVPQIAVYIVSNGTLAVVGRVGSACAGLVAEDGSGRLVVVPQPEAKDLHQYVNEQRSPSEGVVASDSGGCALCNTQEACIVSTSPKKLTAIYGFPLRCTRPAVESVRRYRKTVAYFKTRTGELGLAIYDPKAAGSALATGYLATCTLPRSAEVVCEAMQESAAT